MSEPFDSMAALDLAFMSGDIMSEQIVLTRADGRQYPFSAVIDRGAPTSIAGTSKVKQSFAPYFEFWVPRCLLPSSSPPDKNSDRFTFATEEGGPASMHSMASVQKQDATGWLIRCR